MEEFNMPEGAHDNQHETGHIEDRPECQTCKDSPTPGWMQMPGHDGDPCPDCNYGGPTKVKSTLGPWSVGETTTQWSRCETKIHAGKGPNRGNAFCIVSGGGPSAIHSDAASVEANARLIASAPELRRLLEEVTGVIVAGYTALFPNFAFVDPPSAVERMTMEILNLRGRVEDDGEERESLAKAFDGIIGSELVARRERQDTQWGGAQHDDGHDRRDWPTYIEKFILRADADAEYGLFESYESNMVDIAALAIAAILSSRRKRQCQPAPDMAALRSLNPRQEAAIADYVAHMENLENEDV